MEGHTRITKWYLFEECLFYGNFEKGTTNKKKHRLTLKQRKQIKQIPLFLMTLILMPIYSYGNKSTTQTIIDSLIVGKWKMVEYAGGSINTLDTISFYKNGKMDYPFETGEFAYRFITSDSLAIYNHGWGEQHYKIFKLSNDSLIRQIRRQRIYADSIDELVDGEIEKYTRVTNK